MEQIISYYRKGTDDCPVDISYFSPSVIREKPPYIEGIFRVVYLPRIEILDDAAHKLRDFLANYQQN